ncbi:uncharacterized protein LOC142582760 isoform X3 [Dermacentor variabilis]
MASAGGRHVTAGKCCRGCIASRIRVDAGSKLSNIAGACGLLVEEQLVEFLERVLCVDLELRSARRGSARCDLTHCDSSH